MTVTTDMIQEQSLNFMLDDVPNPLQDQSSLFLVILPKYFTKI